MKHVLVIFALLLCWESVSCGDYDDDDYEELPYSLIKPHIISTSIAVEAILGEPVTFPCEVDDLGDEVILWKRDHRILFAGDLRIVRDNRFQIDGFSLQISSVELKDSGKYTCQTSTIPPQELVHTLDVLLPAPKVNPEPSNGSVVVVEGEEISVGCEATGDPTPVVTWKTPNRDRTMKMNDEHKIVIAEATEKDAGNYECIANNSYGMSTSAVIRVQVLIKPTENYSSSATSLSLSFALLLILVICSKCFHQKLVHH